MLYVTDKWINTGLYLKYTNDAAGHPVILISYSKRPSINTFKYLLSKWTFKQMFIHYSTISSLVLYNLVTVSWQSRPWGANRPPCTIPGIFVGYDFLKAHSKPCKIRHVSTLAIEALTCGCVLSTLPIRLFMEFYIFCLNIECFFDVLHGLWYWALHHSLNVSLNHKHELLTLCRFL